MINSQTDASVGSTLNNVVDYKWDVDGDGDNDGAYDGTTMAQAPAVTVIAPELEIIKSVFTVPTDAGDSIDYQFLIRHSGLSQAAAFDATFTDTLPAELSNAQLISAVDGAGNSVAGFSVTGNTVSNNNFDLALDDTIVLTVNAIVNTTASASTTVQNTAQIDWDTLGDDTQGYQREENTGEAADNAQFVVASPQFSKQIISTGIDDFSNDNASVVAGEYVTYALTVTVPEGTTPMVQISDELDAELIFDTGFSVTAVGSSGVSFSGTPTSPQATGTNVIFDLGTIVNTNTDDDTADTVTVTYRVYADTSVDNAQTLNNSATLNWDADNNGSNTDSGDGDLSSAAQVGTLKPGLDVSKSITTMPSDAGDTVRYEIVVQHANDSTAGAYDIDFSDVVPAGIENVTVLSALDSIGQTVPGFEVIGQEVRNQSFDLPLNDQVTVAVSGTVTDSTAAGVWINNTAAVTFGTLDNENPDDGADLSLIHISEPTRLLSISYAVFCL